MNSLHIIIVFVIHFYFVFGTPLDKIPKPRKISINPSNDVTKVHIIFMNHLDIGFSSPKQVGFAGNVLNTYFHTHFPKALVVSQQLLAGGYEETFRYTTQPFLLDLYLNCPPNLVLAGIKVKCPNEGNRTAMIKAIQQGVVQWHAGAMNINYEVYNSIALNMSLDISARLDRLFGFNKPFRVLSERDVPGITQGVIPDLVANGVFGITHGINSGSATFSAPSMFRWRQSSPFSGQEPLEVLYIKNRAGYPNLPGPDPNHPGGLADGECFRPPRTTEVLCFSFRSDNQGPPQSVQDILTTYEVLRGRYTKAQLVASSLEDFFYVLNSVRQYLPVIDHEIGDTWIQGDGSDPQKIIEFRALADTFEDCFAGRIKGVNCHLSDAQIVNASRFFLKLGEHTWGINSEFDHIHYTNAQFANIRNKPNILNAELSWTEQRQFINLTLEALGNHPLATVAKTRINNIRNKPKGTQPNLSSFDSVSAMYNEQKCPHANLQFGHDGSLNGLVFPKSTFTHSWASPSQPLGQIMYRTYNESDTDFFLHHYSMGWNTGYGKPNSTVNAHPESRWWKLLMTGLYRHRTASCRFMAQIIMADTRANIYYGAPTTFWVMFDVPDTNVVDLDVVWFDKTPTRLMEAIFVNFVPTPATDSGHEWFLSKIGSLISPTRVLLNGSQWQHGVDNSGVYLHCSTSNCGALQIQPVNSFIASPVTKRYGPTVWPAPLAPITDQITGMAFPIVNNIWMCNYIYWYPYHGPGTQRDAYLSTKFSLKFSENSKLAGMNKNEDNTVLRFEPALQ